MRIFSGSAPAGPTATNAATKAQAKLLMRMGFLLWSIQC
jgi:hypothetical protein